MHAKKLFIKSIGVMVVIAMLMAILPISQVAAQASDVGSALQNGGDRLAALQNNDGGWDWPLDNANPDSGSALNTVGPIAQGLAMAYLHTGDADHLTALQDAGAFLLAKTNNFSPSDGYLAATLDEILGVTTYKSHIIANFYGPLAEGTYDKKGEGTLFDTASYVNGIRNYRSGTQANLAAWDIGMGLVGAAACGADTTAWIAGTKAEIDELAGSAEYDVIGLAGAVYGLAFVGEDYNPSAGEHAAAESLADLADILASYQVNNGGFAWNSAYVIPDDGNETIQETGYAILALNEVNRAAYLANILGAADYMLGVQLSTGGWENYSSSGENNEITAEALWGISVAYPLDELWVCVTGDCGQPGAQFDTIQGAVDAAATGATIHVMAGTYTVSEKILVDKPVSIIGPSTGAAEVVGAGGDAMIVFEIISGDVAIQNLTITLATPPTSKVYDALVNVPDLAISDLEISNNIIYVPLQSGPMSDWGAQAISIGRFVSNAQISQNEIYNTRGGIVVRYNAVISITENVIYNTKGGIMNYTGSLEDYGNRTIENNSWADIHNEWDIVWNSGGGPYDQDYNESVLGVSQTNNEAYVVSLMTTETGTLLGNRSHVFVDANTGTTTLHPTNGNMNLPYAKIQDGIDAVVPGGKVFVAAGTYVENIVVDKPLTLIGEGQEDVLIYPALSGPKCTTSGGSICAGSSNVILVQADDVTISGLTIDGDNPSLTSGILVNSVDVDARNGIIKNTNATYQNLEVYETTVKNIYLRGIYSTNGSFNFHHNTVTNVAGEYASIAMFAWGGPGIMAENNVSYANDAISANHSKGIQFLNNTVTFSSSGIHTDNSNDGGGVADVIQGNNIDCTGVADAYGIFTFVPYAAPVVENNTVTNCAVGLSAWGEGAPVVTNFIDNTVTGDLSVGSVGAYITTDLIGWGYSDVSVNFTGNKISNFETGLYFTADQQSWNSYDYEEKTINATFTENSIIDNTVPVDTGTNGQLNIDLSPNWWGSIGGPAGIMPNEVIFKPWCGDEACSFLEPDANDVITLSGTINIPGGIVINQPGLTFLLMNDTIIQNDSPCFVINADYTTITTESPLGAVCKPTDGSNAIEVNGDRLNIVIEGLEIDGADGTNGIDFDGVVTDLVIRDNYIHSLAGDGIYFAAQPTGTLDIQGNLLMGNDGNGIEAGDHGVPAQYNAWGHVDGALLGDGASDGVDWTKWTHADLYLASDGTVYDNQVVKGVEIVYEVYGNLARIQGTEFTLTFPSELVYVEDSFVNHAFDGGSVTVGSGELVINGYQVSSEPGTGPTVPLNGVDVLLFSVTFTADDFGKALPVGLVEENFSFAHESGDGGPTNNVYATALVGVEDLEVIDLPTLTEDDLDRDYIAGLEESFTLSVNNPVEGGEFPNVRFNFLIEEATLADIFSFQYPDGSSGWLDMPLTQVDNDVVGYYIPATLPMGAPYSATTLFRIVFNNPGDYDVVITLDDVTMDWELARLERTVSVLGNFVVTGTVSMQGRSVRSGVPMTLETITFPDYGPFEATSTNVISNNLLFSGLNGGTYQVTTNQARYLNIPASMDVQVDVTGDRPLAALELKGGNAKWDDNIINVNDASRVGSDYGKPVGIDTDGDVNFDGVVNIQDLALVGGNFDLTSEVAYGGWAP